MIPLIKSSIARVNWTGRILCKKSILLDDPGMLAFKRMFESLNVGSGYTAYPKNSNKRRLTSLALSICTKCPAESKISTSTGDPAEVEMFLA